MRRVLVILALLVSFASAQDAAELSWHDTQGNPQNLSQYKGKIAVLNFWATWCVPCQHEMPMLADMQRKYADGGLVVLGGSLDDASTQAHIQSFAEKDKIPFPLLLGASTDQMKQLQLGETIPATAFFDTEGSLVGRVIGELDKSKFQHRIEWMLGKHRGKEPEAYVNNSTKKPTSKCEPPVFAH